MDQALLVEDALSSGRELIRALEASGIKVPIALWLYTLERGDWRLLIATPLVDDLGVVESYRRVQSVLRSLPRASTISLDTIHLMSPRDELAQLLGGIGTIEAIDRPRHVFNQVTRNLLVDDAHNLLIDDAYIYRLDTDEARAAARESSILGLIADTASRMPGAKVAMGMWRRLGRSGNYQFDVKLNGQRKYLEFSDAFMEDADTVDLEEKVTAALQALTEGKAKRALIGHEVFQLLPD